MSISKIADAGRDRKTLDSFSWVALVFSIWSHNSIDRSQRTKLTTGKKNPFSPLTQQPTELWRSSSPGVQNSLRARVRKDAAVGGGDDGRGCGSNNCSWLTLQDLEVAASASTRRRLRTGCGPHGFRLSSCYIASAAPPWMCPSPFLSSIHRPWKDRS